MMRQRRYSLQFTLDWIWGEGRMSSLNQVSSGTFGSAIHWDGEHRGEKELGGEN